MMKKLAYVALLACLCLFVESKAQTIGGTPVAIISNQGGLGAGPWVQILKNASGTPKVAFQAVETGSGSVTSTVTIEVSNDATNTVGTVACTITLSGTAPQSDGCTTDSGWSFARANVTALTGTTAKITVWAN